MSSITIQFLIDKLSISFPNKRISLVRSDFYRLQDKYCVYINGKLEIAAIGWNNFVEKILERIK